ncbi:helix-turn-helix domain-containing protein [Fictibacillus enclensis]|uniref:helix-turn-helix domain-containing protein n=1 Tax=Fictibacillus enclensis TaxID=1017270 RepID=UPI0024C0DA3D|nr:helix-turn-helix domain-containing protein [Fictibacillus enclensis]WHY70959.1 helix-turn-helix domain-containing protein [Fictibacillus enclensis]
MDLITDKKYLRLLEINQILTQSLDIQCILRNLVEAAYDLIEGADTIILYYLNPEGQLEFADGVGVDHHYMRKVCFQPGESLTGHVFLTQTAKNCTGDIVERFMENMSETNRDNLLKGVRNKRIKNSIVVPLLYKEESIGVLVVDNFMDDTKGFQEEETRVIQVIADQAAIAIMNSKLFKDVQSKNEELSNSLNIQNTFMKVLLEGKGMDQILMVISRILKYPVAFRETADYTNRCFPIICSNETLGYLKIEENIASLSKLKYAALSHAATAMALELIKQNAIFEKELLLRQELFQQIMEGPQTQDVMSMMKPFGINDSSKLTCMVLETRSQTLWNTHSFTQKRKFINQLETVISPFCTNSIIFIKVHQVIVLLPSVTGEIVNNIGKALSLKDELKGFVIGIGREVSVPKIAESYQEAVEAAAYCKSVNHSSIATYSELGAERLWHTIEPGILSKFAKDHIGQLQSMDPSYWETMRAFVQFNGNHKQTAVSLHIHPNTLAYRLKKIEEVLDVKLTSQKDMINIILSMEILHFTQTRFVDTHNK